MTMLTNEKLEPIIISKEIIGNFHFNMRFLFNILSF